MDYISTWNFYKKTLNPRDILIALSHQNKVDLLKVGINEVNPDIYLIETLYQYAKNSNSKDTTEYLIDLYNKKLDSLRDDEQVKYASRSRESEKIMEQLAMKRWNKYRDENDVINRLAYDGDLYTLKIALGSYPNADLQTVQKYADLANHKATSKYLNSSFSRIIGDVLKNEIAMRSPELTNILRRTCKDFNRILGKDMNPLLLDKFKKEIVTPRYKATYFDNKLHSFNNEPAYADIKGNKAWARYGKFHYLDGPALIINTNFNINVEIFCANGKIHRDNGPAIIASTNRSIDFKCQIFFQNGEIQSINDIPSIQLSGTIGTKIRDKEIWTNDSIPYRLDSSKPSFKSRGIDVYYKNGKVNSIERVNVSEGIVKEWYMIIPGLGKTIKTKKDVDDYFTGETADRGYPSKRRYSHIFNLLNFTVINGFDIYLINLYNTPEPFMLSSINIISQYARKWKMLTPSQQQLYNYAAESMLQHRIDKYIEYVKDILPDTDIESIVKFFYPPGQA